MARREIVTYSCDVDFAPHIEHAGDVTPDVNVAFDGSGEKKVDMCDAHKIYFRELFEALLKVAHKPTAAKVARINGHPVQSKASVAEEQRRFNDRVRAWATRNGHAVKDRGRVPHALITAYQAATAANGGKDPVAYPYPPKAVPPVVTDDQVIAAGEALRAGREAPEGPTASDDTERSPQPPTQRGRRGKVAADA